MFSRRTILTAVVIVLFFVSIMMLTLVDQKSGTSNGVERVSVSLVSPLQNMVEKSMDALSDIWRHYFNLVSVSQENDSLKKQVAIYAEKENYSRELELSNARLRKFLKFQKTRKREVLAAEVIGKSPSPWLKTIIIDKGSSNGVVEGMPVVVPGGIVGQVTLAAKNYSKVLLILDRSSSVGSLTQRSRARGVVQGESTETLSLSYVLRKHTLEIGDVIVSSGLDGVYPKGLRVGAVSRITKRSSGIFQDVAITPYVDFEKLEEVLVILTIPGEEYPGSIK